MKHPEKKRPQEQISLSDNDISTVSMKGRRALLRTVGGLSLGIAGALLGGAKASAKDYDGTNDNDRGPYQLPDHKKDDD